MPRNKLDDAKATNALRYIVPILEKYDFRWVITGGFACYVYGVDRMLTDIDIDIDISKDSPAFIRFLKDIEPHISQPLIHYIDTNYDNYNVELTYEEQIIDICPMKELLIYDKKTDKYNNFYTDFPDNEIVSFSEFSLPLLSRELIIKNKQDLVDKDKWQLRDIAELQKLCDMDNSSHRY